MEPTTGSTSHAIVIPTLTIVLVDVLLLHLLSSLIKLMHHINELQIRFNALGDGLFALGLALVRSST